MKNAGSNKVIPVFIGIILLIIELLIVWKFKSIQIVLTYAIVYIIVTCCLLKYYQTFDACGWLQIGSWGSNMLCIFLIFFLLPKSPVIFIATYVLLINWVAIMSMCIIWKFFVPQNKYSDFKGFFRLSSIIFGVVFLMILVYALFFKAIGEGLNEINLIPFSTIMSYLKGKDKHVGGAMLNIIANIFLFIPLGFYIGVLLREKKMKMKMMIIVLIPIMVELVQLVFSLGICDVDDVILNAFGGLVGIVVLQMLEKLYCKVKKTTTRLFLI